MRINSRILILFISFLILISLITYFLNSKYNVIENVKEINNISQENEKLRKRVENIDNLKIQEKMLENENEKYKELIKTRDQLNNYKFTLGTVIQRDIVNGPENWYENLRINVGKKQGIKKNMPVVTSPLGIVGKVIKVNDTSSTVQLLTTQKNQRTSQIPSMIINEEDNEIFGIINEYDDKKNLLSLNQISKEIKIKVGNQVVTSNKSSIYPAEIPIGKIVSTEPGSYGLTQTAYVKPFVNFDEINDVFVITGEK